jgi:hypothetical protein
MATTRFYYSAHIESETVQRNYWAVRPDLGIINITLHGTVEKAFSYKEFPYSEALDNAICELQQVSQDWFYMAALAVSDKGNFLKKIASFPESYQPEDGESDE